MNTMDFQCDIPDCDDAVTVTVHCTIDRRDPTVGVMNDRVDVDSIVYPDDRGEVHYADLPDAVLEAAEVAGNDLHQTAGLDDFPDEHPRRYRQWYDA